jgi:hypothetical protein
MERSKMGHQITALHQAYRSGNGQFGQHARQLMLTGATKLSKHVNKKYIQGKGTGLAIYNGPPQGRKALTCYSAQAPTHSGGPASNVYNGGASYVPAGYGRHRR